MNLLYIIYTHNRPTILQTCLQSLFGNTTVKPDRVVIIDDASETKTKCNLFNFALENTLNSGICPIDFMSFNKNVGYGWAAELGLFFLSYFNPKYAMVVESDYIFRKGWCEEALAVLESKPESVGLSGYSNPDYYDKSKTEIMFPQIMKEDFGTDLAHREFLHKPMILNTKMGKIQIQGTTNCCGTFMLNWERIQKLVNKFPEIKVKVFDRCCNKQKGGNRKYFGDGPFTGGLTHYWYLSHTQNNLRPGQIVMEFIRGNFFETEFPWLDICDYSISSHKNACGINGNIPGIREGQTFVESPRWKDTYLNINPRIQ